MGPLLGRKKRASLVVEFLEDRQLLSQSGPTSGWGSSAQEVATRPDPPAPVLGSVVATSDRVDRPMTESRSIDGPAGSPLIPKGDGPSTPIGPARDCATPSPTVGVFGDAHAIGPDRPAGDRSGPAGDPPIGGVLSSSLSLILVFRVLEGNATAANGDGPAPGLEDHGTSRAPSPNMVGAEATNNPPARGGSPGPSASPNANFVPTSRQEPAAPVGPGSAGPSGLQIPPLPSTATLAAPNTPINPLAHGPTPIEIINGQGPAGGPPRVALADGTARGIAAARPSAEPPLPSGWEAGETEVGSGVIEVAGTRPGERFDAPDPQAADMITSLMPFDRSTMEAAIDQFLDPFDGLASSVPGLRGPMGLVAASLTMAVTVLAVDVALRLRRSRGEAVEVDGGDEALLTFPGLPGIRRWSRP